MIGSVFFENLWKFIVDHSKEFVSTIIVLLIWLIAIVVGYFIEKKYSSKKGKKKYVIELAKNIFSFYRGFIIFVGILVICSTWGVKLTSVLIGLAIFFATIALGSRKIIADIIRGLEINFSNLYDLDDIVYFPSATIDDLKKYYLFYGRRCDKRWLEKLIAEYKGKIYEHDEYRNIIKNIDRL